MDDFIIRLQTLLPVLGVDFVRPTPRLRSTRNDQASSEVTEIEKSNGSTLMPKSQKSKSQAISEFKMTAGGLTARAVEVDGQMVVLAGSQARSDEAPSLPSNVRTYREQLLKIGKLATDTNGELRFNEDVAFTSPSAAAQAVMGTSRNGRNDWINVATNETYAAWQDRLISEDTAGSESALLSST